MEIFKKLFKNSALFDPEHDKINKMTNVHSEDSYQPGHLPSLIRVYDVCFMGS